MNNLYELVKRFKEKYPMTIAWRLKAHSKVIEKHINPEEDIMYAFAGQKNDSSADVFHTYVVAITNKRIIVAEKRLFFGYFLVSITPDLFNDLTIESEVIWGKIKIDTLREKVLITNIDKKALPEIETAISSYIEVAKQKYQSVDFQNTSE